MLKQGLVFSNLKKLVHVPKLQVSSDPWDPMMAATMNRKAELRRLCAVRGTVLSRVFGTCRRKTPAWRDFFLDMRFLLAV